MTPAFLAADAKLKFWIVVAFPAVLTLRTLTVVALGERT
jgi:hypothetical protein